MNYEKLTKKLIESCVDYQDPTPMDALLPEYILFGDALSRLSNESGGPAYEKMLVEMIATFSLILKKELEGETVE